MLKWFWTKQGIRTVRQDRLAQVKAVTSASICRLSAESAALRERAASLGCSLAGALGDMDGIYDEREAEDERAVSILERRFVEVEKRSKDIDRELAILRNIQDLLHDR